MKAKLLTPIVLAFGDNETVHLPTGTDLVLLDLITDNTYLACVAAKSETDVWFAVTADQIEIGKE